LPSFCVSKFCFDSFGKNNSFGRHFGAIRKCFHTGLDGFAQPAAVFGVDLVDGSEKIAVLSLDDKEKDAA